MMEQGKWDRDTLLFMIQDEEHVKFAVDVLNGDVPLPRSVNVLQLCVWRRLARGTD